MERDIREWILEWFAENGSVDREVLEANMDENYLNAGYIDSFVFISLIADIEEEFEVEFDNDQFTERSFATLNGLIEILDSMVN